jgi:hypothetical protein
MGVETMPPEARAVAMSEARAGAWSSVAPIVMKSPVERGMAQPRPRADEARAVDARPLARSTPIGADSRASYDDRAAPAARSAETGTRGGSSHARGPAGAEAKGGGTTVEVSIGRIEVRVAPQLRAAPPSPAAPARPAVDLGEYLRRRGQG